MSLYGTDVSFYTTKGYCNSNNFKQALLLKFIYSASKSILFVDIGRLWSICTRFRTFILV